MKIKRLRQDRGEYGWSWIIQDEDWDGSTRVIRYHTDMNGEGIWASVRNGLWVQFTGTCQFSMRGCATYSGAYSRIKRYFEEV